MSVLFAPAIAGCIGDDGPSVTVPWLQVGASAQYRIHEEYRSLGLIRTGVGQNLVRDSEGTGVFPVEEGVLDIQVLPGVQGVTADGRLELLYPIEYTLQAHGEEYLLGTEYMTPRSGRMIDEGWVRHGGAHIEGVESIPSFHWAAGRPDLFMATLWGGRTVSSGIVSTPWYTENRSAESEWAAAGPSWDVTVEDGVLTAVPQIETFARDPQKIAGEFEWDASCPFPRNFYVVDDGNVSEGDRLTCTNGKGDQITLSEPHPAIVGPARDWITLSNLSYDDRLDDVSMKGFALGTAWAAIEAHETYRGHCPTACRLMAIEWSETTRTKSSLPEGLPEVMRESARFLQWSMSFLGRGGQLEKFVAEKAENGSVAVYEVGNPNFDQAIEEMDPESMPILLDPRTMVPAFEIFGGDGPSWFMFETWNHARPPVVNQTSAQFSVASYYRMESDARPFAGGGSGASVGFGLGYYVHRGGKAGSGTGAMNVTAT